MGLLWFEEMRSATWKGVQAKFQSGIREMKSSPRPQGFQFQKTKIGLGPYPMSGHKTLF